MKISFSSYNTFNQCPRKYKYQYLDKLSVPTRPELYFGSLIHQVVQFALKRDPIIPELKELENFYDANWQKDIFTKHEEKQYYTWGKNMIRDFLRGYNTGLRNIVATEKYFQIPLNDKHILSGVIDRVDKLPFGAFEVVDYKTGKSLPTADEVATDKQLATYHFATQKLWPEAENVRLTLHYLKFDSKLTSTRQPAEVEEVVNDIILTADNIEAEKEFAPKKNRLCEYCEYSEFCKK